MKVKMPKLSKDTGYSMCLMQPPKYKFRVNKIVRKPPKINKHNVLEDIKE